MNSSAQSKPTLVVFATPNPGEIDMPDYEFVHHTSKMPLHHLVKCSLFHLIEVISIKWIYSLSLENSYGYVVQ